MYYPNYTQNTQILGNIPNAEVMNDHDDYNLYPFIFESASQCIRVEIREIYSVS